MKSLKIYDFAFVNIFVNKINKHLVSIFTKFASINQKSTFMRKLFIILTSIFFCISNIYAEEKRKRPGMERFLQWHFFKECLLILLMQSNTMRHIIT